MSRRPAEEKAKRRATREPHRASGGEISGGGATAGEIRIVLDRIAAAVRAATRSDLRVYRQGTLLRAVERRMGRVRASDAASYASLIEGRPEEARLLAGELRIGVTRFFRDPEAFQVLGEQLEAELARRDEQEPVRAWIPACSTGEEAYSIAILLLESLTAMGSRRRIQIFASDVNVEALDTARDGLYEAASLEGVSPERLQRYFVEEGGQQRIAREIRELVTFAEHDVLADPPFSRLDLVSCRNLLIYLEPAAQRRVIETLHFALSERGLLLLGSSESPGDAEPLFEPISARWRVYRRREGSRRALPSALPGAHGGAPPSSGRDRAAQGGEAGVRADAQRAAPASIALDALLEAYAPPSALVSRKGEVLYAHGDVSPFLTVPSGVVTRDVLGMVRPELRSQLRAALARSRRKGAPASMAGARCVIDGVRRELTVSVRPVKGSGQGPGEPAALISFLVGTEEAPAEAAPASEESLVRHLERELEATRAELSSAVAELEARNQELQFANEDCNSINEELRSANEELSTSAEELHALNEHLLASNEHLREAQEELRASEERFRAAIQAGNLVMFEHDRDLRYTWAFNPVGVATDDVLGKTDRDLLPPEEAEPLLAVKRRVIETGIGARCDLPATIEGRRRTFDLTIEPAHDASGAVVGLTCVTFDVSARKEAEARLELQARALDQVQDAVLTTDLGLRLTYMNRAAQFQYGVSLSEMVGRPLTDMYELSWNAPEDEESVRRALREVGRWRGELAHVRPGGERIPVEVSANVILGPEREPEGYLAVFRDLRAQRQADEDRRVLEARLRETQKLESLGVLAGGVAHDFNNILLSVLANATAALEELPPEAACRAPLEDITRAARRATDLCRHMLAYAGRGRLVTEPLDLARLVEDTLSLVRSSLARGAAVHVDLQAELPAVVGDATQLRQVVMNLILNASEAIPGGAGEIRISARAQECDRAGLDRATLGADLPAGRYVVVEVQDTGAGMTPEVQRRLFEPFFTTKFTGRGLGMSAVLGIIRAHRGAISVDSAVGRGTTFRVLLPAQGAAPAALSTPIPAPAPRAEQRALLLVDDDEDVRSASVRTLSRAGFQVIEAEGGAAALARLAEEPRIAAVILDLTMPDMSGEEVLRALRRVRPGLPAVLMSGWDEGEAAALLREAPEITAFAQKPWTVSELAEKLSAVIRT